VHVSARETPTGIVFLKRVELEALIRATALRWREWRSAICRIARAREVLERHEQAEHQLSERLTPGSAASGEPAPEQQALFTTLDRKVLEALRDADLDNLKPIDALNLLAEMEQLPGEKRAHAQIRLSRFIIVIRQQIERINRFQIVEVRIAQRFQHFPVQCCK